LALRTPPLGCRVNRTHEEPDEEEEQNEDDDGDAVFEPRDGFEENMSR
jgi:hypothetical protein